MSWFLEAVTEQAPPHPFYITLTVVWAKSARICKPGKEFSYACDFVFDLECDGQEQQAVASRIRAGFYLTSDTVALRFTSISPTQVKHAKVSNSRCGGVGQINITIVFTHQRLFLYQRRNLTCRQRLQTVCAFLGSFVWHNNPFGVV